MNLKTLIDAGKTLCRQDVRVEHLAWKMSTALESLAKELNDDENYDLWRLWPCGSMAMIDESIVGMSDNYEIVRVLCYDFNGNPEYWISDGEQTQA